MNEHRPLGNTLSPQHRASHILAASHKGSKANRLACDICRERKVRCDRDWPKCGRCARLGDNCGYKGRSRGNEAQEDLQNQVKLLQDRLSLSLVTCSTWEEPPRLTNFGMALSDQAEARFLAQQQQQQPSQPPPPSLPPLLAPVTEPTPQSALGLGPPTPPVPWECIDISESGYNRITQPPQVGLPPHSLYNPNNLGMLDDGLSKGFLADTEFDWLNTASELDFGRDDEGSTFSHRVSRVGNPARPLSSPDLARLQNLYFNIVYPTIPILSKDYFFAHIRQNQQAPQVQALSYAVALMGSMVSQEHRDLQEICLSHARHYVELCERDEDMPMLLSLDLFQAHIFLARFELTHRMIVRAWMTVGTAVRLANILRLHLHNPDTDGSRRVHGGLTPTTDPIIIEMRRRSFWSLYICETYASARAGMSPLLQEEHVTTPLPCPGNLDSDFTLISMPTLAESYTITDPKNSNLSSFASIVLACAIARRCQPHVDSPTPPNPSSAGGFWNHHFSLVTLLEDRTKLLAPHLTVRAVKTDPVAFALYVYLCGIDIFLQEVALSQVEREGFAPVIAADSAQRSRSAAYRLAGTAWATSPRDRYSEDYFALHGAFMARPVAAAVQVLGRDLQHNPDISTASTVVDSIHLLLGALDRLEEKTGFWHESVAPVTRAAREWDEAHGDRSADTWAAALIQQI